MSRYSFCIVTSEQCEWACHDTIDCIVTREQEARQGLVAIQNLYRD